MGKKLRAMAVSFAIPTFAVAALLGIAPGLAFADANEVAVGNNSNALTFKSDASGAIDDAIKVKAEEWRQSSWNDETCYVLSVADPAELFLEGKNATVELRCGDENTREAIDSEYSRYYWMKSGQYSYNTNGHSKKSYSCSFAKAFHVYSTPADNTLTFSIIASGLAPDTEYSFNARILTCKHAVCKSEVASTGSFVKWGETGGDCVMCGTIKNGGLHMLYKANKIRVEDKNVPYKGKSVHPSWVSVFYKANVIDGRYDSEAARWEVPDDDFKVTWPKKSVKVGTYTAKVVLTGTMWEKGSTKAFKYYIVPATTKIKSVKPSRTSAKVSWKRKTKENGGYQIRYSTLNLNDWYDDYSTTSIQALTKSTKTVKIKGAKATKTVLKGLKKNKKYTAQIRCWKKVGSKTYYSEWSKVKSFKTKK